MNGWICPRCGTVYAPTVEKCIPCSPPYAQPPLYPGVPAWPKYASPWDQQTWCGHISPPETEDKP